MYGFLIRVGGLELHVWEKGGANLFGLTGLKFAKTKQQWWQKQGTLSVRYQIRMATHLFVG